MENLERQKKRLKEAIEDLYCVEEVYFIYRDGDAIRRYCDMDYNGGGKEVLIVDYKPECYAYSNNIVNWENINPEEARDAMEI